MPESAPRWMRHFVYRTERTRTTWGLRLGLVTAGALALWLTAGWWTVALARSLVCEPSRQPSDVILIENFDPDYLLFERARQLRHAGVAQRVLVPIPTDGPSGDRNAVSMGIADVMARISRIGPIEIIPMREVEPISLNAANDIRSYLRQHGIRSVVLVSPRFRSRRSELVYRTVLAPVGIVVRCGVSAGQGAAERWTSTWHGKQDVAEQWIKLQYYRLYLLPLRRIRGLTSS